MTEGQFLYLVEGGTAFEAAVRQAAQLAINEHGALTTTAHGGIVAATDGRLTDARTPKAHKASHATGGTDALAPADIGAAPTARTVTTTAPLTGGGDLSANRALGLEDVTGLTPGTYERATVTVDAKGRVTSVSVGTVGAVADASPTQKGAVLLSVAMPAGQEANPKVVSDNDIRVNPLSVADFFAFKATTQSLPAQSSPYTVVSFDSESWDTGANFASSAFTAPRAGRYVLGGQVLATGAADGTSLSLALSVDGAELTLIGGSHTGSTRLLVASGSRPVRLLAGQVVRLIAAYNQTTGQPAATMQTDNTFFYGRYEGA